MNVVKATFSTFAQAYYKSYNTAQKKNYIMRANMSQEDLKCNYADLQQGPCTLAGLLM